MNKIDINKKYRYANGKPARILCVDRHGYRPVISLHDDGTAFPHTADGVFKHGSDFNLIEIREPRVVCVMYLDHLHAGASAALDSDGNLSFTIPRAATVKFIEEVEQ